MYDSINKQLGRFSKLLPPSVSVVAAGKGLKGVFSFRMSPCATQHCVAGQMLPASNVLSDTALTG
jgi:hypothetical protein